ncbi:site-2 protease family protein [Aliinostoc sp. HNIBRCY26]|uniref:site-2 protease family protein n=1 Tax=Aliinostoc sp. HNIBRCY26 TaxID=3418997 RepID=UPI003CFE6679
MSYLLYPILITILVLFIQYFMTFLQLCKARFQYPKYQVIDTEQVPTYFQDLLQAPIQELEQLGFKPFSYIQYQPMVQANQQPNWEILLYNKSCKTYATIITNRLVEPVNLFDIEFYTFFQDKTLLLTVNCKKHGFIEEVPHAIVQDAYASDVSIQWLHHQDKLNNLILEKLPCALVPKDFSQALQIFIGNYVKHLNQTGKILAIKETSLFQLHWLTALKIVYQIVQGNNKTANINQQRRQKAKTQPSLQTKIPVELEVASFKHMQQMQQGLVSKQLRTWLFLGSIAVFAASFTKFLTFKSVLIFIIVILFHEGGHILAMKLFGYQDTSVLFVPFLGAFATGHKHEATLSQKFWISLAGPLPGLILGMIIAIFTPRTGDNFAWLRETSWILMFMNLFNLLPIYPLDGGKIANLLLFSRIPFADVAFKSIGLVIFFLLGKQEPGLLVFLILVAFSIPGDFRNAQVSNKLQQEIKRSQPENQEHLLHTIFQYLQQWGYDKLPFQTKYTLVKDLMQRYYESSGKLTTRFALMIFYCFSLFGGMIGSLQATIPGWLNVVPQLFETPQQSHERFVQKRKAEIADLTATLSKNPNDVSAYKKRARLRMMMRDEEGALADYNQVIHLTPNDISSRLTRAGISRNLLDYQGAMQDYNEVIRLNPTNFMAYQQRAYLRNQMRDYQGAIADYNQIIKLDPQNRWVYLSRGEAKQQLKDYKGALADAEYMIKRYPQSYEAYQLRSQVRQNLGDTQGAIADQQVADKLLSKMEEEDPT